MERRAEGIDRRTTRVLVVSTAGGLDSTVEELSEASLELLGPRTSFDEADVASVDCVLTDDVSVLRESAGRTPVVFAIDPESETTAESVLDAGATDVVWTDRDSPFVARRIRNVSSQARGSQSGGTQVRGTRSESPPTSGTRPEESPAKNGDVSESEPAVTSEGAAWHRKLLEESSVAVAVFDRNLEQTYASPELDHGGATSNGEGTQVADSVREAVHPDDRERFDRTLKSVRDGPFGDVATLEIRCRDAEGRVALHEMDVRNSLDSSPLDGLVVTVRPVTDGHEFERDFSELLDRIDDAFVTLDRDRRFTSVNEQAQRFVGYDEEELLGREVLEVFPEIEGSAFEHASIDAITTREPQTTQAYFEPTDTWVEAHLYPSEGGLSIFFRDVSAHVERDRELVKRSQQLETLVENVPMILFSLDRDGRFTLSEGRGLARLGFEPGEVVGESIFDVYENNPRIIGDANRALDGEDVHSVREVGGRVFETWYRPITHDGALDRVIGIGVDVTERVQFEETLSALHESTRHLLTVESKQAASEYVVDVASSVLDLRSVAVYRFDERENVLVPAAYSSDLSSWAGVPPRFDPGSSITWDTFVSGTARVFDDIRESPHVYDPDTEIRSGLYVPLGEHGVLVAVTDEPAQFDDETFELAQLFGATAEAALDRIGRSRRLRERERELSRQNERLERTIRASKVRSEIESLLLRSESRDELEREICDRLVDLDECTFAWIGEPDPGGTQLVRRASAGMERGYLDAVTITPVDDRAAEPSGRAVRTRRPTPVENVADSVLEGAWRAEALSRNFQSIYAVPIVYDDFIYGVLSMYADSRRGFDETLKSTLAELGETIGFAIETVTNRRSTLDDSVTTVDLEVELDTALSTLADRTGSSLELVGWIPHPNDSTTVFLRVDGGIDPEELQGIESLEGCRIIGEPGETTVLQGRLTEPFVGSLIDAEGGSLVEYVFEDGVRAVVDLPPSVEIRRFLSKLAQRGVSVSLLARYERETDSPTGLAGGRPSSMLEEFTERQREVVQAAYHGGFFDWPRRTTGEEIAASLDISPPAFHNHVRSAQRKVFSQLFEGPHQGG